MSNMIDNKSERDEVKIIMTDMLDNIENHQSEKDKLDYIANCLAVSALLMNRLFGDDIVISCLNEIIEQIAEDHLKSQVKNIST